MIQQQIPMDYVFKVVGELYLQTRIMEENLNEATKASREAEERASKLEDRIKELEGT